MKVTGVICGLVASFSSDFCWHLHHLSFIWFQDSADLFLMGLGLNLTTVSGTKWLIGWSTLPLTLSVKVCASLPLGGLCYANPFLHFSCIL